ncbi:hypothetical protein B0H19DRAFT_1248290 [Mycena capillaripes]|nr:hypothetical protein B0H19DRAFT_1248290 [Mycena capillaripes]
MLCGEAGIPKLIKTFISNKILQAFNEPILARVDLGIEPSDTIDFAEILLGEGPFGKKIQGMRQVNGFTPAIPAQMKSLTPHRREMWRRERERANCESEGFRTDAIALVDFAYADSGNGITFPLHIRSEAKTMVKAAIPEGFKMVSAVTGETTIVPYTVETCMEFMNTHIRADKKNQLLLRTEMRPFDIQVIRDVVANLRTVPVIALNEKLARESIYKSVYPMLWEHRKAVAADVGR